MKILDCTLRDGGYYTNWDFDKSLVEQYLKAMEILPVDYVELGYRNKPLKGYYGEYFYLPEFVIQFCKQCCPTTKLSVMLNAKDIYAEIIGDLLTPCISYISLVRIAVDPKEMDKALSFAAIIKSLGFEIGFNIMYMSTWANLENFWDKIEKTRGLVDYVWLVDSYGGVFPEEVKEIVATVKQKTDAKLGFHGHNNLEMAFINSLIAVENGCEIVDATLTGMGRGAGNLKTEMLLTYLVKNGQKISFNELTETVSLFESLQKKYEWGTNLPYMISGVNSLPQKDIMEWISKKRYLVSNIVQTLQNNTANQHDVLRFPALEVPEQRKSFLIVGGGETVPQHIEALKRFIQTVKDEIVVIFSSSKHIQYFDFLDEGVVRYFCLIGSEGNRLEKNIQHIHKNDIFVLSSYPRKMDTYVPKKIKKQSFELTDYQLTCLYEDSPLQLSLEIVVRYKELNHIYLAGFDGYSNSMGVTDNYDLMHENQTVIDAVGEENNLLSLTPTQYNNLEILSIYSFL
jgi:4-hydroxy 2-oxovalerate aldolase